MQRTSSYAFLALGLVVLLLPSPTQAGEEVSFSPPKLRLVHVREGLKSAAPRRDLGRIGETEIFKLAKRVGLDLEKPAHPLLLQRYHDGRLFYVFWKNAERAVGDRPYLIQRIRKTERSWVAPDAEPEERVTYQVEVFKTLGGAIKRPDQHHGSYGLRDLWRREVVKEYEIGFGEIPGTCEGTTWPYDPGRLFEYVQRYAEERGPYDAVRFFSATKWSLRVEFAADGTYRVTCEELGFDAPASLPDPSAARTPPDEASKDVVLTAGLGLPALELGVSERADVVALLGDPIRTNEMKAGANVDFPRSVTANFDANQRLNTLFTRPGFAGSTDAGIRHGDPRWRVMKVMGVPRGKKADARTWGYDGVLFWFDAFEEVEKIVIFRPRS